MTVPTKSQYPKLHWIHNYLQSALCKLIAPAPWLRLPNCLPARGLTLLGQPLSGSGHIQAQTSSYLFARGQIILPYGSDPALFSSTHHRLILAESGSAGCSFDSSCLTFVDCKTDRRPKERRK